MYTARTICALFALALFCAAPSAALAQTAAEQYAIAAGVYSQSQWEEAVDEFQTLLEEFPDSPHTADATFYLGEAQLQLQRFASAQSSFEEFLRRHRDHAFARQAQFRVGEIAYLRGDHQQGKTELERFQRQAPFDELLAYALPYLGDIALQSNNADGAQAIYSEALERFSNGPLTDQCRFGLGRALQMAGDSEQALRFYRLLASDQRSDLADDAQLQIGVLYYDTGEFGLAELALLDLEEDFAESELLSDARYWRGMAQIAQQQWPAAAETLTRAASEVGDRPLAAAVHFAAGEALRHAEKADQAAERYRTIADRWPESEWADDSLQTLVQLALAAGDHHMVQSLTDQFELRYGDSPLLVLVRQFQGRSLLKRRDYAAAAQVFERLLGATSPQALADVVPAGVAADDRLNFYYLALAYLGQKQYPQVLQALALAAPGDAPADLQAGADVARASALVGMKRYREAVAPLRSYLRDHPGGTDAARCRAQLSVALAAVGELDAAAEEFELLRQKHPAHRLISPTAEYLAESAYAKGDHQRARLFFQHLAGETPDAPVGVKGLSGLAWTELANGDPARAAALLAQLLAADPEHENAPKWALLRAATLAKLQQYDAALDAYQLVADKYADSEHAPHASFETARLYEQLEQLESAVAAWRDYVKRFPDAAHVDAALYSLAWALVDLKRGDQADEVFQQIRRQHQGSQYWGDATYRLAERAARGKDYAQADQLAAELVEAHPDAAIHGRALYLRGQVAAARERWADVAAPMQTLLSEHGDSPLAFAARYWIAEAAYRRENYSDAAARFAELASATEGRQESWVAMIPLRQAQIYAQQRRWSEAFELAEQLTQRFPDFPNQYEADYLLGRCYASRADFDAARTAYQRVVNSPVGGATETAARAQWMIGETYLMQKRYDEAVKAYRRVEQLFDYPRWRAAALMQTGKCREKSRRWDDAAAAYERLIEQFPESELTPEASRRLQAARQQTTQNIPSRDD